VQARPAPLIVVYHKGAALSIQATARQQDSILSHALSLPKGSCEAERSSVSKDGAQRASVS